MENDSFMNEKQNQNLSSKETNYLLSGANGKMLRKSLQELENGFGIDGQISDD